MRNLAAMAALVTAACGSDPLVGGSEQQALVADTLAEIKAHESCAPDPRIAPLLEGTSPLGACVARAHELSEADIRRWLAKQPASVAAWRADCDAVFERALAGERPMCSPYQLGLRAPPAFSIMAIQLAKLAGDRVRRLAAEGRGADAIALARDTLMLLENTARGHVGLLATAVAHASLAGLGDLVDKEIDALSADDRVALAHGVDEVLANLPPPVDALIGEQEWGDLHRGLVPLLPAGWPIPGGDDHLAGSTPGDGYYGDPRDEPAIRLLAGKVMRESIERTCAATGSIGACFRQLPAPESAATDAEEARLHMLYVVSAALGDIGTRDALVAITADRQWMFTSYVQKMGYTVARLSALRLHAAGACPAGPVDVPALGDALAVARTGDEITIKPPAWVKTHVGAKRWTYRCSR